MAFNRMWLKTRASEEASLQMSLSSPLLSSPLLSSPLLSSPLLYSPLLSSLFLSSPLFFSLSLAPNKSNDILGAVAHYLCRNVCLYSHRLHCGPGTIPALPACGDDCPSVQSEGLVCPRVTRSRLHWLPQPCRRGKFVGTLAWKSSLVVLCPGVSGSTAGSPASSSVPSTSSRQRQRITRVNLRDIIFYMEQERETAHSLLLYRALLK
ncbi:unnamed protein product [Pleuronectes platessa]|uniref:Transcription initiation factor TFIID component TAF4 C-terminal domain-containing protein n=1 Tax=Pleuronectes platessa TaxID=8262 RepID=A0A9N7Z7Q9_PLEPL|nr:unnamed protein product [Pleuronectes platessa]